MIRRAAVTMLALAACVGTATEECPDHSVCSDGRTCVYVAQVDRYACATREQIDACTGRADGEPCDTGTCFGGGCVPQVCGDGIVDAHEVCDDANLVSGDGCAKDCASTETCGNGVIDLARGEQCDTGDPALGGDGCTLTCRSEYRVWHEDDATPPEIRFTGGVATDPVRGLLLYGGATASASAPDAATPAGEFNDTWRFDGATWLELRSPQAMVVRNAPALANDRHGHVLEFGGISSAATPQNDTWEWDTVTWRKRAPATVPMARSSAALACAPAAGVACVMFGGFKTALLGDTWKWDGATWTAVLPATTPAARKGAQLVYDTKNARYILFGGEALAGTQNDVWTFANDQWTLAVAGGSSMLLPHPSMIPPSMAWDEVNKRAVLIAGGSTWFLDPTSFAWTNQMAVPGGSVPQIAWDASGARMLAISPNQNGDAFRLFTFTGTAWNEVTERRPGRASKREGAAYDERRGVTVIADSSTLEWNGVGYTQTVANPPQSTFDGTALAYHAACATTVSFGGGGADGTSLKSNELFRYPTATGTLAWAAVTTAVKPTGRTRVALADDRDRRMVVMFGGFGATTPLAETWELSTLDCATWAWEQRTPATSPSARSGATLVYDLARHRSVLFGGTDAAGNVLDDTWEWDGAAWTQRATSPAGTPTPRTDHMSAYDPRRRRVVVFGGRNGSSRINDTWEWDEPSASWVKLAPATLPLVRSGGALTPDAGGDLIAIGGEGAGGVTLATVSRFSSELSSEPRETCTLSIDADGDGKTGCADPDCWSRCTPTCLPGTTCAPADPKCGDGACDPLEDWLQCPADCPAPPI